MMDDGDAQFWSEQWTDLLGMAAAMTNSADAVMDAMRGDLGLPPGSTTKDAAPMIAARIDAYLAAKRRLIDYSKAMTAALEAVATSAPEGDDG